jgi:hypothetical protein
MTSRTILILDREVASFVLVLSGPFVRQGRVPQADLLDDSGRQTLSFAAIFVNVKHLVLDR